MATLSVIHALCVFVMASCVSEAKYDISNEIIFNADQRIAYFSPPSHGTNRTVTTGRNITFVCRIEAAENNVYVQWYRNGQQDKTADVQYYNGKCRLKEQVSPRLSVEQTDCEGGRLKLKIKEVDASFQATWFCVVTLGKNVYQSQYIRLHIQNLGISTSRRTPAPTTSPLTTTVSRHEAVSSKPTEAATEHTTERIDKESPSRNILVPLIGGTAGGGIVMLVLVITGCTLYRSKRDGQASTYPNRQSGNAEAVVMEGNPLYMNTDPGTDDYAQIDYRESASSSHEQGGAIVVNNQPNPDDGKQSQAVLDSGDIYAMPDKSKKSAAEEKGEARLVSSQLNPDDRNQGQAVLDSGDIYAMPDKSKKSAAQDVEVVCSKVQKPKK